MRFLVVCLHPYLGKSWTKSLMKAWYSTLSAIISALQKSLQLRAGGSESPPIVAST